MHQRNGTKNFFLHLRYDNIKRRWKTKKQLHLDGERAEIINKIETDIISHQL